MVTRLAQTPSRWRGCVSTTLVAITLLQLGSLATAAAVAVPGTKVLLSRHALPSLDRVQSRPRHESPARRLLQSSWNNTLFNVQLGEPFVYPDHVVSGFGVYVINAYTTSASSIQGIISAGLKPICWFSAGMYDPWRDDRTRFPPSLFIGPAVGRLRYLNISSLDVRQPMLQTLTDLKNKGCLAVAPGQTETYSRPENLGLTAPDAAAYVKWLADAAKGLGLQVGLVGTTDIINDDIIPKFDFALGSRCFTDNTCTRYSPFRDAGKPVFMVEYKYWPFRLRACGTQRSLGIRTIRKTEPLLFGPLEVCAADGAEPPSGPPPAAAPIVTTTPAPSPASNATVSTGPLVAPNPARNATGPPPSPVSPAPSPGSPVSLPVPSVPPGVVAAPVPVGATPNVTTGPVAGPLRLVTPTGPGVPAPALIATPPAPVVSTAPMVTTPPGPPIPGLPPGSVIVPVLPMPPMPPGAPVPMVPLPAPGVVTPGPVVTPAPVTPLPAAPVAPVPGAPVPGAPLAPVPGAPLAPVPGAPVMPVPLVPAPGAPVIPLPGVGVPPGVAVPGTPIPGVGVPPGVAAPVMPVPGVGVPPGVAVMPTAPIVTPAPGVPGVPTPVPTVPLPAPGMPGLPTLPPGAVGGVPNPGVPPAPLVTPAPGVPGVLMPVPQVGPVPTMPLPAPGMPALPTLPPGAVPNPGVQPAPGEAPFPVTGAMPLPPAPPPPVPPPPMPPPPSPPPPDPSPPPPNPPPPPPPPPPSPPPPSPPPPSPPTVLLSAATSVPTAAAVGGSKWGDHGQ